MAHKQYVATLDKNEAKALIKAAQERIDRLDAGKIHFTKIFKKCFDERTSVNLFGMNMYVVRWETEAHSFRPNTTNFYFDNGTKIVFDED